MKIPLDDAEGLPSPFHVLGRFSTSKLAVIAPPANDAVVVPLLMLQV
jgi:hypothetical protein